MLTFSCTSFRSASLDVEPIYTFRAHRWVFDKNTVLFEKYKIFKQTKKILKQFLPCQLVVPCHYLTYLTAPLFPFYLKCLLIFICFCLALGTLPFLKEKATNYAVHIQLGISFVTALAFLSDMCICRMKLCPMN